MIIASLIIGLAGLIWSAWLVRAGLVVARIYQIEEYETLRLLAWGRQRAWLFPGVTLLSGAVALLLGVSSLMLSAGQLMVGIAWLVGAAILHLLWKPLPAKKPLVYTPRMQRILSSALILTLLFTVGFSMLILVLPRLLSVLFIFLLCVAAAGWALLFVICANILMLPVEAQIRRSFMRRARARINAYKPFVIGIAGSYGKTSTKHILTQLLSPHIETLMTPKSFNTLMGITRTINENLESKYRIFVVEMDAYDKDEIAQMCRLVEPGLAVITSVGPQHLERFGSVERIADALYELVEALPAKSPVVVYGGERFSSKLAERAACDGYRVVRYGIEDEVAYPLDVVASNIMIDEHATHFMWRWPDEGLEYPISMPLLGKHNILNVSAALAVIHLQGLPLAKVIHDVQYLEPVAHRLQLLPRSGGISVIDDSYNANPVGIHNGLDVLEQMHGRAKILVTPGMVELGSLEIAENKRLGEHAAQVCDQVVLVGAEQTKPIYAGLREGGLAAERIHVVYTLEEVTQLLGRIAGPGDVVLFANDLPDSYLELS